MSCTAPDLKTNLTIPYSTVRRALVGPTLTIGLLCGAGVGFAAEPSDDAMPSPLDMSIIQGLSGTDSREVASPAAASTPAAVAPSKTPAAQPAASAAQAERRSQVIVVEMPQPAEGSAAAEVEKRLSAFDMNTIRGLVAPPGDSGAASVETSAAMQSAQAPGPMAAPSGPAAAAQPKPAAQESKPAAQQPLPDSQMELIRDTFSIEGAG